MEDRELVLSIFVPTYNHEKYIAQALDSVLMQKTEYPFEVLVGDDCSTDGTREILKLYEKKYPKIFQMFYREKNMYREQITNAGDLKLRCKGKYVICLEGDDYWTDEKKIDQQIKFLEENPEYFGIAHNCIIVDKDSKPNREKYPECKEEEYTLKHYVSEIMPGQLTTFMYRNCYRDYYFEKDLFFKGLIPGERLLYFAIMINNRIFCEQKVMSAYRHIKNGGTSFSANYNYNFKKDKKWHEELKNYTDKTENKEAKKYADLLYFKCLMQGLKVKQCSMKEVLHFSKIINSRYRTCFLYIKYWVNYHILKKKIWV